MLPPDALAGHRCTVKNAKSTGVRGCGAMGSRKVVNDDQVSSVPLVTVAASIEVLAQEGLDPGLPRAVFVDDLRAGL
jgi:hypothetical protein